MNDTKLKHSEINYYRGGKWVDQIKVCPLCLADIKLEDAVLDHCHNSGRIRGVVHPECNILLGKIENFLKRYPRGLKDSVRVSNFLSSAYSYMVADYTHNPFHPKHMSTTDKEIKRLKKILKRSKRPETIAKYTKLIQELK